MRQGGSAEIEPDDIPEVVRACVGSKTYQHWFADRTRFEIRGSVLRIAVASPFLLTWMQKQLRQPLQEAAVALLGPSGEFELFVDGSVQIERKPAEASESGEPETLPQKPVVTNTGAIQRHRRFANLRDFVVGKCNNLAYVAATKVAEHPGQTYSPLFVHGLAGSGKTHLLEGIYCEMRRRYPDSQVLYLTSEAFINYFTEAQRTKTMPSFRQRFRNVDMLLLDDFDFFGSKKGTQEEVLHTITQLQSHGRQVVISADCHPRLLPDLRDELSTRFMAGMVCRLEAPDEQVRQIFAERKVRQLTGEFTADAVKFVAKRFKNSLREVEGALNCLDTHFAATQERITLTVARRVLSELERDCQQIISITDIEGTVASMFGVTAKELRSPSRVRRIARPRMLAMYLARRHTEAAYQEIGRHFGNRNHSTVMSAEKKVLGWIEDDTIILAASRGWTASELVNALEEKLLAG